MKRVYLYVLLIMGMMVSSCEEHMPDMPDLRMKLDAEIQEMAPHRSRAIEDVDIRTGSLVTEMNATVWFSETSGVYPPNKPVAPTFLPYRANLTYDASSTIVYTEPDDKKNPISYDVEEESNIYCVGFYPQNGWTTNQANTIASHEVNGMQDLMFAKQQSGSLFNKMDKQVYEHLLVWLKFTICATGPDAVSDWGKIQSITLKGGKGNLEITLGSGEVSYTKLEDVIDVLDSPTDLSVSIQDIGSALCIPENSYSLEIKMDKGTRNIELSGDSGFEKGRLYLVTLYFNPYNEINAVCSLVPWNEENVEL